MNQTTVRQLFLYFFTAVTFCGETYAYSQRGLKQELNSASQALSDARQLIQSVQDKMRRENKEDLERGMEFVQACSGRLTVQSNTPVTTTNLTGQSTIYFTPYQGSRLALYTGTIWKIYTFTQISLALTGLTAARNYDVFVYDNAGTLTLELSTAWTSNTARATALVLQDGVYVKSGVTTRRYLGTFRSTAATTTEDSSANRFLWNYYNRRARFLSDTEATNNWAAGTINVWRSINNLAANSVQLVVGDADGVTFFKTYGMALQSNGGNSVTSTGIGIDTTTVNSAQVYGLNGVGSATTSVYQTPGIYYGYPGLGSHIMNWIEIWGVTNPPVWYGNNNIPAQLQAGFLGWVEG